MPPLTPEEWRVFAVLGLAAFCAGALNAVAGGGTLLTFPALFSVLQPELANATSTVALLPGSLAGAWGYRHELATVRAEARRLLPVSFLGGALGAGLLVLFPNSFRALVPWLILGTAVLFVAQRPLTRLARRLKPPPTPAPGEPPAPIDDGRLWLVMAFQLAVAVYGGYFGAGIGILMLAMLGFLGIPNIHHANAVKTLLAAAINSTSVVVFLFSGFVVAKYAAVMALTSLAGGYLGARVARRVPAPVMRGVVIAIGFGLAGYYFWLEYGRQVSTP